MEMERIIATICVAILLILFCFCVHMVGLLITLGIFGYCLLIMSPVVAIAKWLEYF